MFEPVVNWTYPEERAQWCADHPAVSQKHLTNSPKTRLELLQKKIGEELDEYQKYLEGKLLYKDGTIIPGRVYYCLLYRKLFYIEFPQFFEREVYEIYEYLDSTDRAWINNTREVIKKYHEICTKETNEIWPQRNEQ